MLDASQKVKKCLCAKREVLRNLLSIKYLKYSSSRKNLRVSEGDSMDVLVNHFSSF